MDPRKLTRRSHVLRSLAALTVVLTTTLALTVTAGPAAAGGSSLETTHSRYEPGQRALAVGYSGRGQLGWIEDGPFYASITEWRPGGEPNDYRPLPGRPLRLGRVQVTETGKGGWLTLRLSVAFTVPQVAPGSYYVTLCNDPCTTGIGEIVGLSLAVSVDVAQPGGRSWPPDDPAWALVPPEERAPTPVTSAPTTAPEPSTSTTTSPPTTAAGAGSATEEAALNASVTRSERGEASSWWPAFLALGTAVLLGAAAATWRHRARTTPPAGGR